MSSDYSTQELMIVAAAREINDGERIFVGMRLPITAYGVARLTHAPNAVGLFESGVVRYEPAEGMHYTMCDGPNQLGAAWTTGLIQIMGLLSGGRILFNGSFGSLADLSTNDRRMAISGGKADVQPARKRT